MIPVRLSATASILMIMALLSGCATTAGSGAWGSSATASPGWDRVGHAAKQAASHPGSWVPLLAAAGLQIDNADENLSDWARREAPVFGSTQAAIDASDHGVNIARGGYYLMALAAPSGDDAGEWLANKAKGLFIGRLAVEINSQRPDGSDSRSFPSGHAAKSSAYANMSRAITPVLNLENEFPRVLDTGFLLVAAGTGWARVEGGKHYPSDVLAGYALGNFMSRFFNAAFLDNQTLLRFGASPDGVHLEIRGSF